MQVKSYKDLLVWQKSIQLTNQIYTLTEDFPQREMYGLSNQMRRGAVSVPSNIAEGSTRGTKEFLHFINISRGSLAELETQLLIAQMRSFISDDDYRSHTSLTDEISRMLMWLMKSLKSD